MSQKETKMDRTYTPPMLPQNTPAETTPAVEKLASGIGNVVAVPLAVLIAFASVLFLLVALQPILSILVALIVFPIVLPLAAFLLVWFDVGDSRVN
jgi:hypothetical protein